MTREMMLRLMFAQMRDEMEANARKGARWVDAEPEELEWELLYHTVKLIWAGLAKDTAGVREYAADVGNHAAMLAARLGALHRDMPAGGNAADYLPGSGEARALATNLHTRILGPST